MATRSQIFRISQLIEALGHRESGPRLGIIYRLGGETDPEARQRHQARYPHDDVTNMPVIAWHPMSAAEWVERYWL
jgi:hypothetical protein